MVMGYQICLTISIICISIISCDTVDSSKNNLVNRFNQSESNQVVHPHHKQSFSSSHHRHHHSNPSASNIIEKKDATDSKMLVPNSQKHNWYDFFKTLSNQISNNNKTTSMNENIFRYYKTWLKYLKPFMKQSLISTNRTIITHDYSSPTLSPTLANRNVSMNSDHILPDPNHPIWNFYHSMFYHFHNNEYEYPQWENLTKEEQERFLQMELGKPNRYNQTVTGFLTAYYGSLLLIGVPGNVMTCMIILTNSYMRTPPNIFLFNLAVVDLVTLTMIVPLEMKMIFKAYPWPLGEINCKFATILCELVTYVSIITMIVFSLERYLAICHPLKLLLQTSKRRTVITIFLIWIISFIPSIMWSTFSKVEYLFYSTKGNPKIGTVEMEMNGSNINEEEFIAIKESSMCIVSPQSVSSFMLSLTVTTTVLFYVLPIIILPIIYYRISKALKKSERHRASIQSRRPNLESNRKTVIKMQVAVIVCFLLCWTPYHALRIMFVITSKNGLRNQKLLEMEETLHLVSGCSYYLSSAINPFLYSLLSKRFRNGFRDLKNKCFKRLRNLFNRSTSSRTDSSRRATNITNGINKSSLFDGFSMTPMTIERNCSKHDSTILVDANCDLKNSNFVSFQPPSSGDASSKASESTNLEKEMFLLALQIKSIKYHRSQIRPLKNRNSLKNKKPFNHRLRQIPRSCTWHDELETMAHQTGQYKMQKRKCGKEGGRRYKRKVKRGDNRRKNKNNINVIINPVTFHHHSQQSIHNHNNLQRFPVVHDLRNVGYII